MNTNDKAKIALECIEQNSSYKEIGIFSTLNFKELKSIENNLRSKAYLAFSPPILDIAVAAVASTSKSFNVIQVGANDGLEGDPVRHLIYRYASKALLIEPVPFLIEKLQNNYKDYCGKLIIENVLIGENNHDITIKLLNPTYWDSYINKVGWHPTQISSIYSEPLITKISSRLEISKAEAKKRILSIKCKQLTLHELIKKHNFESIDLLQVDCEGHDFNVIESLNNHRPKIINFESFNLNNKNWQKWRSWAKKNEYGWIQGPKDTLAILGANFISEYQQPLAK